MSASIALTETFNQLITIWNPYGKARPATIGFFLSEWVARLDHAMHQFEAELANQLRQTDSAESVHTFHYLRRQLEELLPPIASLSTAAATNLLAAVKKTQSMTPSVLRKLKQIPVEELLLRAKTEPLDGVASATVPVEPPSQPVTAMPSWSAATLQPFDDAGFYAP
ncbi:MAG: hypothetical protein EOO61_18130 [Hymenobacter sp.]|nr:MAG: hypothetical protein EOO61_18130 [Hymenobacter sp.]